MNPHDTNVTRSLVLLVCQFRHFRILYITQPFSLSMPTTNDMILWHKENVNNYFGKSKSPKIASVFLKFLNIPSVRFRFASSHCRLSHYASPCPVRFRFAPSHCRLSHYASPCPVRFRFASSHCGLSPYTGRDAVLSLCKHKQLCVSSCAWLNAYSMFPGNLGIPSNPACRSSSVGM